MRDKITDGLKQGGKIIFVRSTSKCIKLDINIDASQTGVIYTLKRALEFAINHQKIAPKDSISEAVFGTAIDYGKASCSIFRILVMT